jgi:uncharacterized protein (TIGR00369 family)
MTVEQSPPSVSLPEWLGIEVLESSAGAAVARLRPRPEAHNYRGVVAGGSLATLADVAMAVAANSALGSERWSITSGLELHYLRPARGVVTAYARAVHTGRTRVVVEGSLTDEAGKAVVQALGTFVVVEATETDHVAPDLSVRTDGHD